MTTLIEQTQALLAPIVVGRVFYQVNTAQPPVFPYITWVRVASDPNVTLAGPTDLQNTWIQVDIYSRSVAELDALTRQVESAFRGWSVANTPLASGPDLFDLDTQSRHSIRNFSVWSKD